MQHFTQLHNSISRQLQATFQQSAVTFQGSVPQTSGFHQSVPLSFVYLENNYHVCDINTLPVAPNSVWDIINQLLDSNTFLQSYYQSVLKLTDITSCRLNGSFRYFTEYEGAYNKQLSHVSLVLISLHHGVVTIRVFVLCCILGYQPY